MTPAPDQPLPDQSWLRMDTDTEKSWFAFRAYRDQTPPRTLARTVEELKADRSQVQEWATKHRWRERVLAFDRDNDTRLQDELIAARADVIRRHLGTSRAFQQKVLQRMQTIRPSDLNPTEALRWMEFGLKTERTLVGLDDAEHNGAVTTIVIDGKLVTGPTLVDPPPPEATTP